VLRFRERRWLHFIEAESAAMQFEIDRDLQTYRKALSHLADGYMMIAQDTSLTQDAKRASAAAVLQIASKTRLRKNLKVRAQQILGGIPVEDYQFEIAIGISGSQLAKNLQASHKMLSSGGSHNNEFAVVDRSDATTADLLSEIVASREQNSSEYQSLEYDKSDSDVKVTSVQLLSFRGSPSKLEIDLQDGDKPTSVLILGDNGTGKSSIVDAIEFGLQARVGRSSSFDSPVGPSLVSFSPTANGNPSVEIWLSDNSSVKRTLEKNSQGELEPIGEKIRPGFRLAPITLKRQDILRFLDTDGLERGQIFFDYFPESVAEMALRPEEKLERLRYESHDLRIRRTTFGRRLAELLHLDDVPTNRELLIPLLKEKVTGGVDLDQFDWTQVEPEIGSTVTQLRATINRLSQIKKEVEQGVQILNPVKYRNQARILERELAPLGEELTKAFRAVTRVDFVERIDVAFGVSGPVALDVVVQLVDGTRCFPQQLFSEGFRDIIAVLFFTSVAKRAALHGQSRTLILDDVFQSVDSSVRGDVMNYLLEEFRDWQLIVTVHDRLWMEKLRALFRSKNHRFKEIHLRPWHFKTGPTLQFESGISLAGKVQQAMDNADPSTICGVAGHALEEACDNLSWRLRCTIQRRQEDRYTLADLWPGVRKAMKNSSVSPVTERIESMIFLRNTTGAHFNEWAQSLSLNEALDFGQSIIDFLAQTWCASCGTWVRSDGKMPASCNCGSLTI
jgi:recombinational DNA repair ATPase RecF